MDEQKASDDQDQQKKVQFEEGDSNDKQANQEKDNKRDNKASDNKANEEDEEGRASRASRTSRTSSADNIYGQSDDQKLENLQNNTAEKSDDSVNQKQSPNIGHTDNQSTSAKRTEDTTPHINENNAKIMESNELKQTENIDVYKNADDVNKDEKTIRKSESENKHEESNDTSPIQASYSLNSRQKDTRVSESSNNEENAGNTQDFSNYETDDMKVSKNEVSSPTHSTKSKGSAKYMGWEDSASEGGNKQEESEKPVNEEQEKGQDKKETFKPTEEPVKEKKEVKSEKVEPSNKDDKNANMKPTKPANSNTPTTQKEKKEPAKNVNSVTIITKRQSAVQPQPQTQEKKTRQLPPEPKKDTNDRRQISKSATYRPYKPTTQPTPSSARDSSRASTARSYRPPSRPRTTLGFDPERRRERDFFHKELQRLKDSLRKESKTIKKPKVRDHYPDVFTSLEPYYNTYTANYLIKMPDLGYKEKQPPAVKKSDKEERDIMYTTRCTAIGLCDPYHSLNMDNTVLPKLETAEIRKKRIEYMHASEAKPKSARASSNTDRNSQSSRTSNTDQDSNKREKRPEAKQGSTRLPKFPVIVPPNSDLSTKELHYGDVPMLRDELIKSFSHFGEDRKKSDYDRTRQDFYRMELDRLDEYHQTTRPHMRAAYFAYLQNTPGSRKAIYDCMKEMGKPKKKEEQTAQAVA